ncbi:MAG: glycosyltransferase [Bacteroidetes bacterium]|nr:glycosyltransferase [Bacteroidota bacterium]
MEALAWLLWGLALVPYTLYPAMVRVLGRRPAAQPEPLRNAPHVSIVFAAYNEEAVIEAKLQSLLAQDYPGSFDVWVGSDQSTDRTDELLADFAARDARIHWVRMSERSGKAQIINRLVAESSGAWVVGTDANIWFAPDCLSELMREAQANPRATVVGGSLFYRGLTGPSDPASPSIANEERWYMNWENFAKRVEYERTGCAMGVEGGLYAIRRDAFRPIPFGTFMEDFFLSFSAMLRGEHVAWSLSARGSEDVSHDPRREFRRKVRIAHGNWQNVGRFAVSMLRLRPAVLVVFLGHKLLRWLTPLLVLGGILAAAVPGEPWSDAGQWAWTLFASLSAYTLLVYSGTLRVLDRIPGLRTLHHLLLMNLALGLGFVRYLRGGTNGIWEPTPRTP